MDENEYLEKLAKSDMDLEEKYIKPSSKPLPTTLNIKNQTKQLGLNSNLILDTGKQIVTQKKPKYTNNFDEDNSFGGKKHKKRQTKQNYKKSKRRTTKRKKSKRRKPNHKIK